MLNVIHEMVLLFRNSQILYRWAKIWQSPLITNKAATRKVHINECIEFDEWAPSIR